MVFENFRPPPVREVLPALLAFVKRTDRDARYQAGALGYVVRFVPDNAGEVGAVLDFLDRPLDREARIQVLNALGTPQTKNPKIIDRVIAFLDDREIRSAAADVLARMSHHALLEAQPTLERLAEDRGQTADVRDAARMALERIGHSGQ